MLGFLDKHYMKQLTLAGKVIYVAGVLVLGVLGFAFLVFISFTFPELPMLVALLVTALLFVFVNVSWGEYCREHWRTDRDDKTPTVVPVGSETGDDTILATTDGQTLSINYVVAAPTTAGLDPTRCQAITRAGTQCKRKPSAGTIFCWQHGG